MDSEIIRQLEAIQRDNESLRAEVATLTKNLSTVQRQQRGLSRRVGEAEDTALIPWDWINVVGIVACVGSIYLVDVITGFKLPNLIPFQATNNTQEAPIAATNAQAATVVNKVKEWVGKAFKPGESARCADFVRSVFSSLNIQVGVTQSPIDGQSTNPDLANSFFGADLGTLKRDKSQLQPGDLVAFGGTYGGYPPSTITHVGIYVGNGQMVDRPTANEPVKLRSIDTFEHFVAGITLKNLQTPSTPSLPVAGNDVKLTPAMSNNAITPQLPINSNGRRNLI